MNVQVEMLEKSMAKITVELPASELDKAINASYNKQKKSFAIPGFRKGKVPRQMIEKLYGVEIFFEDATNTLINESYPQAYDEANIEITSQPEIEIVQIAKGQPFIYTATVAVKPEVTLGQYKGLEVAPYSLLVSDEEVDAKIAEEAEKNAREISVERPVEKGDKVILDFVGTVDGVEFEGGRSENYPLEIGSGSFIPGFEDQLVGAELEKEVVVNVTFPEDYQAPELQGKDAEFKCTVHEIKTKELPEIDDDFAAEVSDYDTLEEYKADVKTMLIAEKEREGKGAQMDQVLDLACANATVEIPAAMLDAQTRQMADRQLRQMQNYGISKAQYLQMTGLTEEQFEEQMRPAAEMQTKQSLVLEAIAVAENIEVSDERLEEELASMAKAYSMELEEVKKFMSEEDKKNIKKDIACQMAVDFMVENAVVKAE